MRLTKPREATGLKLPAFSNLYQKRERRSHGDELLYNQPVTGILGPFFTKLLPIVGFSIADSSKRGLGRASKPEQSQDI